VNAVKVKLTTQQQQVLKRMRYIGSVLRKGEHHWHLGTERIHPTTMNVLIHLGFIEANHYSPKYKEHIYVLTDKGRLQASK
jgi:hypothetical protein